MRGGSSHEGIPVHSRADSLALRQAENGTSVVEVWRKMGIAEQTFCRWKKRYVGMGVAEVRRLKVLEEEDRKLRQLVAALSLDEQMR